MQGITDAFEPDLSTEQRAKRVAIAAGTGVLIAGFVATIPETAVAGGVLVGLGLGANALADWLLKPFLFDAWGLNPTKQRTDEAGERP